MVNLNTRPEAARRRAAGNESPWSDFVASLSPNPDLGSTRNILLLTLVLGVIVCLNLARQAHIDGRFNDSDDATRLVLVRDLLAGRGWYDQLFTRFNPPQGTYMHWSRLLDGALAGTNWVFRLFLPPKQAEWALRFFFPLAWIFPAIMAILVVVREQGSRSAVAITGVVMLFAFQLFGQFIPGRIDHHDIQITFVMAALAFALLRRNPIRWAAFAGASSALGLAIGLEALPFQGIIGASYALALARDKSAAGPAAAYGLALAGGAAAFYMIQTPPWRWAMSFCDAMAINLVGGLVVCGLGLAATAWASTRFTIVMRLGLLLATAMAAVIAYLGPDPACAQGPFAAVDPTVKLLWFNHVVETQALPMVLKTEREVGLLAIAMMVTGTIGSLFILIRQWRKVETGTLVLTGCFFVSVVLGYTAYRMQAYTYWLGVPVVGVGLSWVAKQWFKDLLLPSLIGAAALSPTGLAIPVLYASDLIAQPSSRGFHSISSICFTEKGYAPLAALPKGVVLSEIDMGPFIVAFTHHDAVQAPYHRLSRTLLAAHYAFDAPLGQAESRVRALHATYIMDCAGANMLAGPGSFGATLRSGRTPPWMQRLSPPKTLMVIYRVLPPAPPTGTTSPAKTSAEKAQSQKAQLRKVGSA